MKTTGPSLNPKAALKGITRYYHLPRRHCPPQKSYYQTHGHKSPLMPCLCLKKAARKGTTTHIPAWPRTFQFSKKKNFLCPKMARKSTTNILARPGMILRDHFRDFFRAGLWAGLRAGSNHYCLVIPSKFSFDILIEIGEFCNVIFSFHSRNSRWFSPSSSSS